MSPQLEAQLAAKMAELQAMMTQSGMSAPNGAAPVIPGTMPGMMPGAAPWAASRFAAPAAMPAPIGWSVPIEIPIMGPMGPTKVTVDLSFSAESWMQAEQVIAGLIAQGYPVRTFTPKPQGFGGGFNGNGGGYPPRAGYSRPYGGGYPPRY